MDFEKYHFHIYFEPSEIEKVQHMVKLLEKEDHLEIGRIWDRPVGPHPIGSCQITVLSQDFYETTQWFLQNRDGLSLFVHALSGDDLKDHTDYVMWIGKSYQLNLDMFKA